jgi:HSP20 family protein
MAGSVTRWDPFSDLSDLRGGIDRVMNDWFDGRGRARMPEVDVVRDDGHLVVRADLPGIKPEEVNIEIENGMLTVSGHHEESSEERRRHYLRRERRTGTFTRSLPLPEGVKPGDVTATTKDGVLEVILPLPPEAVKEKITITPTAG